jgi:AcrR family transcriptional regulator
MNKETRQRLIQDSFEADLREVALELFAKHGFDAVSSSDIAFAAGISERLLHLHFSGTEDILLRGFCESGPEFCKALMAMPRTLLPVDALQLAMASQTAPSISLERVHAIMILCEDSPRLRGLAVERCQSWQKQVASALRGWEVNRKPDLALISGHPRFLMPSNRLCRSKPERQPFTRNSTSQPR